MRRVRQHPHKGQGFAEVLKEKRWFQHKEAELTAVNEVDHLDLGRGFGIGFFEVSFEDHPPELYLIPVRKKDSHLDVVADDGFLKAFFDAINSNARLETRDGRVSFQKTGDVDLNNVSFNILDSGSSNTLIVCRKGPGAGSYILKMLRRLIPGKNIEALTARFLEVANFKNMPQVKAEVTYKRRSGPEYHLATMFEFVENKGSAWDRTQDEICHMTDQFIEKDVVPNEGSVGLAMMDYNKKIYGLGRLLASLHVTLSGGGEGDGFGMHQVTDADIAGWREGLLAQAHRAFSLIKRCSSESAFLALSNERTIIERLERSPEIFKKLGWKIRQHADFHLGQVLFSGDTFYIIDFEGEPLKPYEERGAYYPALKDVAGMIRSFNYAAFAAYYNYRDRYTDTSVLERVKQMCQCWEMMAARSFLDGYYGRLHEAGAKFLPLAEKDALRKLLAVLVMEKALYEVEYELNNRPDWAELPIGGILSCVGELS